MEGEIELPDVPAQGRARSRRATTGTAARATTGQVLCRRDAEPLRARDRHHLSQPAIRSASSIGLLKQPPGAGAAPALRSRQRGGCRRCGSSCSSSPRCAARACRGCPRRWCCASTRRRTRRVYFSLLRNTGHRNVSHLMREEGQLAPDENTLTVVPGFIGAYPNAILRATPAELPALTAALGALASQADYSRVRRPLRDPAHQRRLLAGERCARRRLPAAGRRWRPGCSTTTGSTTGEQADAERPAPRLSVGRRRFKLSR